MGEITGVIGNVGPKFMEDLIEAALTGRLEGNFGVGLTGNPKIIRFIDIDNINSCGLQLNKYALEITYNKGERLPEPIRKSLIKLTQPYKIKPEETIQ